MFVFGKQKVGKTTFAKLLAQKLNIEYIDQLGLIDKIFTKIKLNEEDPKVDDEGNPIPFLTEIE